MGGRLALEGRVISSSLSCLKKAYQVTLTEELTEHGGSPGEGTVVMLSIAQGWGKQAPTSVMPVV